MHCSKAPCVAVCPVDALYHRPDGIVHVNKETCIGCGYCLYACPFGAPQFPKGSPFGARGVMDKCTYCAGGPEEPFSEKERQFYGSNRIAEGKLPMCASICSTLLSESSVAIHTSARSASYAPGPRLRRTA
jgi:formate dehydrogenase iron-sulfur subunit